MVNHLKMTNIVREVNNSRSNGNGPQNRLEMVVSSQVSNEVFKPRRSNVTR